MSEAIPSVLRPTVGDFNNATLRSRQGLGDEFK
jgi:hypothetical protein